MKYNELVEAWNKSRERSFDYKFEVGAAFNAIYQRIAKELDYYKQNSLNDYMQLYPIQNINEEKISNTSFSLYGAITYEKFGWSALILQINTNSTNKIERKGYFRFVIYMKTIEGVSKFLIDETPYEKTMESGQIIYKKRTVESIISSNDTDYIETAMNKILNSIPNKKSWDKEYISELNKKIKEIRNAFIKHLEGIDEKKLKLYSDIEKIQTDLGYLSYEINDWCTSSLSLLLELKENTYPKLNLIFTFKIRKSENDWYIKFDDNNEEVMINNEQQIDEMIKTICTYQDTFSMWLKSGDE